MYASDWTVEDVQKTAVEFFRSERAPSAFKGMTFDEAVATWFEWLDDEEDERAAKLALLNSQMASALAEGKLRIVCGVDEKIDALDRLVRYFSAHSDLQVVLLQVNKFPVEAGFHVLIPTLQGDNARTPGRRAPGGHRRLTLDELIDAFPEGDERAAVSTILREAAQAGATFEPGPSGTSIRVKCARWKPPVTIGWVFAPGKEAWLKTQQITFGHGLDYPNTDPQLLSVLETYFSGARD